MIDIHGAIEDNGIIIGYIVEFLKENKIWIIITIIVTLLCHPIEMIWLSELFTNFTTAINNLEYDNSISILWKIAAVNIFIDSVYMIGNYFDKIYFPKMEKFIRFKLIDVIFKNIEVNYDKEDISNHIIKTLKIPNVVTSFTGRFIYWIVTFILTTIVIMGYILYLNVGIGLLTIFIFTLFLIMYYYILLKTKNNSEERENEENTLLSNIDDVLSNSLSIICTKKVDDEMEYLTNKHNIYDNAHQNQLWNSSVGGFALSFAIIIVLVFYVYVILILYKRKKIDSKITIKLIFVVLFFVKYIKTSSQRSIGVIAEYGKITENENSIRNMMVNSDEDGKENNIPITGDIEFKNVSFEYNEVSPGEDRKKILDNVSFRIEPLKRTAIIGTNGSGKSTLIKLMSGFFKPTEGQILFDGVDISQIKRDHLRSNLSIVSQKVVLFNRSVIDNICYGAKITKEEAIATLNKLKVMNVFKKLPQGLDTMAGSRGENLSGGQRQIIYLLRSYLSNKPITIMDEPTAAVDVFHKKYVIEMINEMSKKSTLIVVTHDSEFAASFPMKVYIESGKITRVVGGGGGGGGSVSPFSYV
jgi:ABC-type bacteriocin/lantibiotic exporter with double-glycine peptidase domain